MENPNYYAIIPAEVRYDKKLRANEKLLYGEISALTQKNGECWASNNYFADLYDVTAQAISKWILDLAEKGYIEIEYIKAKGSKNIDKRIIKMVSTNIDRVSTKDVGGYQQKFKENNTSINNKKEEERKTENRKSDLSKITKYYEDNITLIVPTIVEEIESYLEDGIEAELIITCIKEAVDRNHRNWKYIKTILNDCYNNKVFTVERYEIKQKEFKKFKNKKQDIKISELKYSNDFSEYDNYIRKEVQNE